MIPRFKKSRFEPKPIETDYWIDLNENEYGGVFKYYDNNAMVWKQTESITREKEPQFVNSAAYNITTTDISNWNAKVGIEDFDALKEEVLNLGSVGEYVTMDTLKYYLDIFENEGVSEDLKLEIAGKADKSTTLSGYGIQDAYTKKEITTLFNEYKVDLPEGVSAFKNDAGYVTEKTLADKLPDDIVSDENYVHTDNNFTTAHKTAIDGLAANLDKLKEADKTINTSIASINKVVKDNNDAVQKSIAGVAEDITNINEDLLTKANIDEVYTRTYLDDIHSQFVKKRHAVYGFIDDRPTLEVTDTGHIFYDYTVNEALIWIADEWRILRSNTALENFILDEDIDETGIGMWEIDASNNSKFGRLTKYVGDYETTMDLVVPNVYIKWFTLALGVDTTTPVLEEIYANSYVGTNYTGKNKLNEQYQITMFIKIPDDKSEKAKVYKVEENEDWYKSVSVTDVFGNETLLRPKESHIQSHGRYDTAYKLIDKETVPINSFKLSQGIRRIENGAFNFVQPATNTDFEIPAGVEYIGEYAFANSNITSVSFPRNPMKFGNYAFALNPVTKVTFPKTLDFEDIKNGGGSGLFAYGTKTINVELKEGVKAIPRYCFRDTPVNSIIFPKSLEFIGRAAFYNSYVAGEFNSSGIKTIQSWAFRYCKFNKIVFDEALTYIAPNVFLQLSGASPCTSINLPINVEKLYPNSIPSNLYNCGTPIVTPPKLKNLPAYFATYYAFNINSSSKRMEIPLVLSEGLESIGYGAFSNALVTGELKLPESLKYISSGVFTKNKWLTNTSLRIGKNVKVIGGGFFQGGGHVYSYFEDWYEDYKDRLHPVSKNGYPYLQFYDYLEDGGTPPEYGWEVFYQFGLQTMTAFECDEENEYFKSVDGVLFSKDGKRLVAYPCAKNITRYEVPEGCEYFDCRVFSGTGYKYYCTTSSGTGYYPGNPNGDTSYMYETFHGENPLREIVLPNSIINYTPMELLEKFPMCWIGEGSNMLCGAVNYFGGIERFIVKEDNPRYKNVGDFLLSKDGTTLEVLSMGMKGNYTIPDTVTTIKPGAFDLNGYVDSNREARGITPSSAHLGYPASMWMGLNLTIPKTVVNMDDLTLWSLNVLNKMKHSSVTFASGNPAFKYNSSTGNYERV